MIGTMLRFPAILALAVSIGAGGAVHAQKLDKVRIGGRRRTGLMRQERRQAAGRAVEAAHIEALEDYCSKNSISHVLISSGDSIADIVLTRFPEVGMLR